MIVKKKLRLFCENRMTPHGGYTRVGAIFAKSSVGWEYVCGSGLNRRLMVAFSKDVLFFCIPPPQIQFSSTQASILNHIFIKSEK